MLICDYEYCGTTQRWLAVLQALNSRDWDHKLAVQVRIKNQSAKQFQRLAESAKSILPYTVRTLLNDDAQVAVALGYDGVHLPQSRINTTPQGIEELGWVSVAIHQVTELATIESLGAHSIVVAPVFQPRWKASTPLGLSGLSTFVAQSSIPTYALGGISLTNVDACRQQHVHGIAVLSSVLEAQNPVQVLAQYLACFNCSRIPRSTSPN